VVGIHHSGGSTESDDHFKQLKLCENFMIKKSLRRLFGHVKTPLMMKSTNVHSNFNKSILWTLRVKIIIMNPLQCRTHEVISYSQAQLFASDP
jgi:hypothetical protein